MRSPRRALSSVIWSAFVISMAMAFAPATAPGGHQPLLAQSIPSPERHFGHVMGADRQLVGWADMVEYLRMVGDRSPRVLVEETGRTTHDRPFLLVQVSASETVAELDRYKELQRRLYFQDHRPGQDPNEVHTAAQREELLRMVRLSCNDYRIGGALDEGVVQMAGDQHQITLVPVGANAAGGVSEDDGFNPQPGEEANGQGDCLQSMSLVIMEASPGGDNR